MSESAPLSLFEDPPSLPDYPPEPERILHRVFGFESFRQGQGEVIGELVAGRPVLAVMPTGSGKSLCYQVPALALGGLTVVISPLVALMEDQVAALKLAGVAAETINSSRDRSVNVETWRRVAAGQIRLLYLAPERLMTERMLAALARLPLKLIAVDEAHCISQWGPSFRPEYAALEVLRERFPGVPIAALTATADEVTREDIVARLFGGRAKQVVTGFDRPNIQLAVTPKREWKRQLLDAVRRHDGASGIVYCLSRKKTEEVAALLSAEGIRALPYHAGLDASVRTANQETFLGESGIVMVATIAFGMGIDKPDIRFVIHTDIPGSPEAYYQEIGRAGRDGEPAEALLLYGLDDIRMRRVFITQEDGDEDRQRREHKRLDALIAYCEAPECRRRSLLHYFGEEIGPCGNCDVCIDPVELVDGGKEARSVLKAVRDSGQLYGAAHIVDILRGSQSQKIRNAGHDDLEAFGAGMQHDKGAWRTIIRQLVSAGFLVIDVAGYGGLRLTQKGELLLRGQGSFSYRPDLLQTGAKAAKAEKKAAREAAEAVPLDEQGQRLLAALKRQRRRLAEARGVPAYVIFSDRSLQDMARRQPRTEDEFAEIHGVGAAKLKELAGSFLKVIAAELDGVE